MNINAQQAILNAYILIFIFRLRFPPGISIAINVL